MRLLLAALIFAATPCAAQTITEQMLMRPMPGGTVSEDAVRAVAPAYALSEHGFAAADGTRLHAVLLRQPKARGVILYFGGNGFTIERFGAAIARTFAPLGMDVMIVDHRGYGMSGGIPTAALLETDGLAVFDYLARLPGTAARRIVVHGQSLGSFTAGYVAAHRRAAGLVLESSVTATEDWAKLRGPGVTVAEPLKGRGNLRFMTKIAEPLLLLVGSKDATTPPRFSEALYAASTLPRKRRFLEIVEGAGHNDALAKEQALAAYRRFLGVALR